MARQPALWHADRLFAERRGDLRQYRTYLARQPYLQDRRGLPRRVGRAAGAMKLASFEIGGHRSIGVVLGDEIADIAAGGALPATMEAFLSLGVEGMARARSLSAGAPRHRLADAHLLSPVTRPQ